MKIIILNLAIFLSATVALGVIALPLSSSTNRFAGLQIEHQHFLVPGKLDRIEQETERVEGEPLILIAGVVSSMAAIALIATRDRVREVQRGRE